MRKMDNAEEAYYSILIVDDEPLVCAGLMKKIPWNQYGFEVFAAAYNGADAMDIIKGHVPDVVLTDIKMPRISGIDLLLWIKREQYDTEVIFLTGHSDFEYARDAVRHGALDFLLKPLDRDELEEAMRKARQKITKKKEYVSNGQKDDEIKSLIDRVRDYTDENFYKNINLKTVAAHFDVNPSYLSRAFSSHFGISFSKYLNDRRMERVKKLLSETKLSIKEIAAASGYNDERYFYRLFKQKFGNTASEYRVDQK